MYNLFAKADPNALQLQLRLNAIWNVEADETYSTVKNPGFSQSGLVALRTLSGDGRLYFRDGTGFSLPASTLGVFTADRIARYDAGPAGWKFFWFEFDLTEGRLSLLNEVWQIPVCGQELADLQRCMTSLGAPGSGGLSLARSLFQYLMCQWMQYTPEQKQAQLLISLLEQSRYARKSVGELAREAGMSERSFRDAVHRATGCSPVEYIRKVEMDTALELLRTTDMGVGEISACLFYSNPFYFSRSFKEHFGITPQQARAALGQKQFPGK